MDKINFIFGLHSHQPVGNFPHVFEESYEKAYKPFIDELIQHPEIKVTLHYTGILLEWLLKEKPEFMESLKNMVSRGQVEIMGGGFYEPVLPLIPDDDKIGQIKKMADFVRLHLGTEVRGIWLAERIWEPHLAKAVADAGIEYIVVDDSHFKGVGLSEEDCTGYYVTEEQGRKLKVFPISEKLRYLIPFKSPRKTIDYLKEMSTPEGDRVLVLADDGEKFGSWPETYKSVYEGGWLYDFFELLKENSSWLETVTFSHHLDNYPSKGIIYLPTGSYREMMEWSGGFWRNFLVRYPESNQMHKKMLFTRKKVTRISDPQIRGEALDHLWAGQCNCAYWHGVFGGLYLNFLRSAVYSTLIKAQVMAEQQLYPDDDWLEVEHDDFLYDGHKEIMVNTKDLGVYISPFKGGSIFGLDYKPKAFNLLDTLTRRPESYHKNIYDLINYNENGNGQVQTSHEEGGVKTIHEIVKVKEEGLEKYLIYDSYQRVSLLDHFLNTGETLDNFKEYKFTQLGNFLMEPYKASVRIDNSKEVVITLSRDGRVQNGEGQENIYLEKKLKINSSDSLLNIKYNLKNKSKTDLTFKFGVEFNFSFLGGYSDDRYYYTEKAKIEEPHLASSGELKDVDIIGIKDEWMKIGLSLSFNHPADVWRFPIETVSQSEDGMERSYQNSVIFPYWELKLSPGQEWDLEIVKEIIPG
ncbi:MAG: hypothetical protein CVU88_01740 [Firmicutes bacterium HGW-Firmicutes-13]|nr:MAG: hypothetical protein CVU88_01740 [Firmicutes bacterium HGW-Firmicutes-13]